jgi:DNA sulfur modification protein DndC
MVTQDRSMQAMIRNDEEKSWMLPLLSLRNALDVEDDRHLRDFRRSNGSLMLHRGRLVHGPYTQAAREDWLRRLLEAQTWIRANGPEYVRDVELVTLAELHEIRRLWVFEKYEFEDSLPGIYEKATGSEFPSLPLGQTLGGDVDAVAVLWEVCDGDEQQFLLLRELLGIERRFRTSTRRAGLLKALEGAITKYAFADEEEALGFALDRAEPYADVVPLEPLDAESTRGIEPPIG